MLDTIGALQQASIIDKVSFSYRLYKQRQEDLKEAKAYYDIIGYICKANNITANPAVYIGSALRLASLYKMTFGEGTSYGDCRVDLPRSSWQQPLNETVSQFEYGVWYEKPVNEIDSIFAYRHRLELAICRCLVFAKKAGVII